MGWWSKFVELFEEHFWNHVVTAKEVLRDTTFMGWLFSSNCRSETRLDGKTAVVTGSNTGIGKETVLEFYRRGARVLMACRDLSKAEAAVQDIKKVTEGEEKVGQLVVKHLDLSSFESVRKCADEILEQEQAIHLLVNNAGIMACPKELSADGIEMQFATNHLGHYLLTLLLLPRIIRSAPARIITVSSIAHLHGDGKMHFEDINLDSTGYTPIKAYGRSKLANILFSAELARRLEEAGISGVNTYSLHPGVVATELGRHFDSTFPLGGWLWKNVAKYCCKTPKQGAQTTLYCALDDKCANQTGLYYKECAVATPFSRATKKDKMKELWDESFKVVKLPEDYNPLVAA